MPHPVPKSIAELIRPQLEGLAHARDFELYDDLLPRLDALRALRQMGWSIIPGERVSVGSLAGRLRVTDRHRCLLGRILDILATVAPAISGSPHGARTVLGEVLCSWHARPQERSAWNAPSTESRGSWPGRPSTCAIPRERFSRRTV